MNEDDLDEKTYAVINARVKARVGHAWLYETVKSAEAYIKARGWDNNPDLTVMSRENAQRAGCTGLEGINQIY